MSGLEQRYRRLLRVYPRSYRQARGEEMLGTLLESAAPGQSRPAARDVRALVAGGLKVRAGSGQRLNLAGSMRLVVLLAACLDITGRANYWFYDVRGSWGPTFPSMAYSWFSLALGVLAVAAVALAWSRWRVTTLIVTAATAGLWIYHPDGNDWTNAITPVLALAAIAITTFGTSRPRLRLAWIALPGALLAAELTATILQFNTAVPPGVDYVPFILLAITILWSIADARPMPAAAIWIAWDIGSGCVYDLTNTPRGFLLASFVAEWVWESLALIALIVAAAGIRQLRRQSVL